MITHSLTQPKYYIKLSVRVQVVLFFFVYCIAVSEKVFKLIHAVMYIVGS